MAVTSMKLLPARPHGYVDYVIIFALAFAPALFALSRGAPRLLCYGVAVLLFLVRLLSASPLIGERGVPFRAHGLIELLAGLAMLAAPWVIGFATDVSDRNFFLGVGGVLVVLWVITDYGPEPATR